MLSFALGLGLVGATVMVIVTIPATREGRGPWTWWARKRVERAQRIAERPVPTAEERFARGFSLRRVLGLVLQRLPRRRRRGAPHFVTPGDPVILGGAAAAVSAAHRVAAKEANASTEEVAAHPLREKVDERVYVAQVEAQITAALADQADYVEEIVVMTKKRIPMPEVIEADPIDADIINPRILSGAR